MDLSPFLAVLAAFHFTCTDPQVSFVKDLAYPGIYLRMDDDRNLIRIREDEQLGTRLNKIVMHELLHCGLHEDRVRTGAPHPRSMDRREEMAVQQLTEIAMERLN